MQHNCNDAPHFFAQPVGEEKRYGKIPPGSTFMKFPAHTSDKKCSPQRFRVSVRDDLTVLDSAELRKEFLELQVSHLGRTTREPGERERERESEVKERELGDQAIFPLHTAITHYPPTCRQKKAELFNLSCSVALIPSSAGEGLTVYDTPPTKIRLGIKTPYGTR